MTKKVVIALEYGYYSLMWMIHKKLFSQINKRHTMPLKIVYQDYRSSLSQLLEKNDSAIIYYKNVQLLAI